MKHFSIVLLCATLLGGLFSGCQTANLTPAQKDALGAGALQVATNCFVVPFLEKNPSSEAAILAIAATIDGLSGGAEITPGGIDQFLEVFAQKWKLTTAEKAALSSGLAQLWQIYSTVTGAQSAPISDPRVRTYLTAFSHGITGGVALYHATRSSFTVPAVLYPPKV